MIATGETDPTRAEVPFFLPTVADPTVGLTGHAFVLGEVQIRLPGAGGFVNATVLSIVEKGFGIYAVQLNSGQTVTPGLVYVRANVSGAQPFLGDETIGDQGGDIAVGADGYLPFDLPNVSDPIFGSPVTGHTFVLGEVKVALPTAAFSNATLAKISEVGFGAYQLFLSSGDGDTAARGKAYIYANVSGAQPYHGWIDILGLGTASIVIPTPPPPLLVANVVPVGVNSVDHVATAVAQLKQQYRFPAVD